VEQLSIIAEVSAEVASQPRRPSTFREVRYGAPVDRKIIFRKIELDVLGLPGLSGLLLELYGANPDSEQVQELLVESFRLRAPTTSRCPFQIRLR